MTYLLAALTNAWSDPWGMFVLAMFGLLFATCISFAFWHWLTGRAERQRREMEARWDSCNCDRKTIRTSVDRGAFKQ